jgi:hypothetical protein
MISLSDRQLAAVMDHAKAVDPARRDLFLRRVGSMLKLRGRFNDSDVVGVCGLAVCGLTHERKNDPTGPDRTYPAAPD